MKLLIVEDEQSQIQLYLDVIDSFNSKSDVKINPTYYTTLKDAKEALANSDYDAAIVDLKLSSNTKNLEGLDVVDEIVDKLRFPVFIVSGSIGQIERDESSLFKKRSRDGDFKQVLDELCAIYNTGITQILGKRGTINEYLNKIFWSHLSSTMGMWTSDTSKTREQKEKILLRYTLLHIQEYLELTEESDFEHYHAAEIYIMPTIKTKVFTGDIVENIDGSKSYIVLTPSCDLAQSKAKDILIAEIETEGLLLEKINIIKKNKGTQEDLQKAKIELKKMINNSYSNKYHFLPKYSDIRAGLINFQKLLTVRVKDFDTEFNRKASINSSFTKDIVARFSYYYSRQGSPDFDTDDIFNKMLE